MNVGISVFVGCICLYAQILRVLCPSQVLSGGRLLALNSAQVSDTGRYTCVAVNAGGEQHRDYDVRVYGKYCFIICQ